MTGAVQMEKSLEAEWDQSILWMRSSTDFFASP